MSSAGKLFLDVVWSTNVVYSYIKEGKLDTEFETARIIIGRHSEKDLYMIWRQNNIQDYIKRIG